MFFTCKNFFFSDFTSKKNFSSGDGGGAGPYVEIPSAMGKSDW